MNIGIDILGGDYEPEVTVLGSILALQEVDDNIHFSLFGKEENIIRICERENFDPKKIDIVHCEEKIGMDDYPAKAFAQKPGASIPLGFKYLKEGKIDVFASAGNTGAMMVGALKIVNSIPGVIRPCITISFPKPDNKSTILLDVGINPDCKPDVLYQYGILGSLYSKHVFKIDNPRVGLLNIGSEEERGNLLTRSTYQVMKGTKDFNFIGNVEGNDIFKDDVDVIVCDGFAGNVMLKEAEAFYNLIKKRNINDNFFEKFNFENYGGTPILGINTYNF